MSVIIKILKSIVYAVRGTAEMIGMLILLVYIVGRTANGEWALHGLINGSIDKNGVVLTIVFAVIFFALGGIWRGALEDKL